MPTPRAGESEADYVKRCIPMVIEEGTAENGAQAAAICHSMYQQRNNADQIELLLSANEAYQVRHVTYEGRHTMVVPVVMMAEGVHVGNHGATYYPVSELGRIPEAWNGIPIVIQHPEDAAGNQISANSPEVIECGLVGRVYNVHMDGPKLRGECYLDEARLRSISAAAHNAINNGLPLEVSAGIFTEEDRTPGTWNGEDYSTIAINHRPDHLALLPGGRGACSWNDGCGIRANKEGGAKNLDINKVIQSMKESIHAGIGVYVNASEFATNECGYREIMSKIQTKLDGMDDDVKVHFLTDVYKDRFIYEVRNRSAMDGPAGEPAMYQRNYSLKDDSSIEFDGEPVGVRRQVEYVTQSQKGEITAMADQATKKPCCPGKVDLLIKSVLNTYSEADKPWLNELTEEQINKMIDTDTLVSTNKSKEEKPTMTKEEVIATMKEHLASLSTEQALAFFPKPVADQLNAGLVVHNEQRQQLVETITNNSTFKAEELANETFDRLQRMADMIKPKVDFSLNAGGASIVANSSVAPMINTLEEGGK